MQVALGRERRAPWAPAGAGLRAAGCAAVFQRRAPGPGEACDPAFAAAALLADGTVRAEARRRRPAPAPFRPGLLALREGPLLEEVVRALAEAPQVLLVGAAGRDHPRRAGLALHLGAVLGIPTVGVTSRPLAGRGPPPRDEPGAASPVLLDGELVALWVRVRAGARPLVAQAAWRTSPEAAAEVVLATAREARTPEPLRRARRLAREERASSGGGGTAAPRRR